MLFFGLYQRYIHSVLFKVLARTIYSKIYQRNCVSQNCPHKTLPKQILCHWAPSFSMLFFGIFQINNCSMLSKGIIRTILKLVKESGLPYVVYTEHCPSKYETSSHHTLLLHYILYSKETPQSSCSTVILN